MEKVLIAGAGFMGSGIAQVCAQAGNQVHLMDVKDEALARAMAGIEKSVSILHRKGLLKEEVAEVMGRITTCGDLAPVAQADWLIEAVIEVEELKHEIFKEADRLAPATTCLASNTSSIPISRLAAVTGRPDKVLGLHFFGPVPLMRLVEVVRGDKTSEEVMQKGVEFSLSLGQTPVRVEKDIPGFVMNRIFSAAFAEAIDLVAAGVVTPADTDIGMKLGYGWGAGPFEVADNAGLDTFMLVGKFMELMGEERLVSRSDMLQRLVSEGRVGRKVGKGFYDYDENGKRVVRKS